MKATQPKPNSFLWPILQISWIAAGDNGFQRIFTGNVEYEGDTTWGDYLYLLYNNQTLSEEYIKQLRKHTLYHDVYDPEENETIFIFKLSEEIKRKIVSPFLKGKYSLIDRDYVKQNFRKHTLNQGLSINWRILHKDPLLKQDWEDMLGRSLPEDAEVWSKPEKEDDIYKFEKC